jgi:hypothetical protein
MTLPVSPSNGASLAHRPRSNVAVRTRGTAARPCRPRSSPWSLSSTSGTSPSRVLPRHDVRSRDGRPSRPPARSAAPFRASPVNRPLSPVSSTPWAPGPGDQLGRPDPPRWLVAHQRHAPHQLHRRRRRRLACRSVLGVIRRGHRPRRVGDHRRSGGRCRRPVRAHRSRGAHPRRRCHYRQAGDRPDHRARRHRPR